MISSPSCEHGERVEGLLEAQSARFEAQQAEIDLLKARLEELMQDRSRRELLLPVGSGENVERSSSVGKAGFFEKQFHSGRSDVARGSSDSRMDSVLNLEDEVERNTNEIRVALESPSIYIVKSVRGLGSQGTLSVLVMVVFFIQTLFPLWFLINMCLRKNPTLIAPGFHKRLKYKEPTRERLLHYFAIEISSAVFILYIAWSAWNRRSFETLAFFVNARSRSLRNYVLYLGYASQITTIFCVVFMTYVLVRLEPRPHQLLLNAVALDYLVTFDINVVEAFHGDPNLVKLLKGARDRLSLIADDLMNHGGAIVKISRIARTSSCALLAAKRDDSTHYRRVELVQRFVRELYLFVGFALLVLSATGGHVAHSHVANFLWIVHIEGSKPDKNKDVDRYPFNRMIKSADSNSNRNQEKYPDRKYLPMAAIIIIGSYICIYAAGCYFDSRKNKRRKARQLSQKNVPEEKEEDDDEAAEDAKHTA